MKRIALPAKLNAGHAFGRPDLSDICVTCAGGDARQADGPGARGPCRVRGSGHRSG